MPIRVQLVNILESIRFVPAGENNRSTIGQKFAKNYLGGVFMPSFYDAVDTIYKLWDIKYTLWISEELFSLSWFVILIAMIGTYTILFIFIDRSRLREILFYGSLLSVSFGYLEVVATTIGLWGYKTNFLPFAPGIVPFSYTLPVPHLLVYQYTSSWKSFAIANTIMSLFFAFVVLPLYVWVGVLWLGGWNYVYAFIMTMIITFFVRAVVIWLANIEQNHATQRNRISLSPKLQPAMKLFDKENDNE